MTSTPFRATTRGGPGASLKPIAKLDNELLGSIAGSFYGVCRVGDYTGRPSVGRTFLVILLPIGFFPTAYACNR